MKHPWYEELEVLRDDLEIKIVHWALSRKADIEAGKPDGDLTRALEREVFESARAWPVESKDQTPPTKPIHNKAIALANAKDDGHMRGILRNDLYQIALIDWFSREI